MSTTPTPDGWHPRGPRTWPEWRKAVPGVTRVEHVRSGRRGTFLRWPRQQRPGNPGYAVIEWDPKTGTVVKNAFTGLQYMPEPYIGRVVAYAFDLKVVED